MALIPAEQLQQQGLGAFGQTSLSMRVIPDAACKVHGVWHRYRSEILHDDTIVLTCECGDVQWKERPKNA